MAYTNFQNCTRQEYEEVVYSGDARNKLIVKSMYDEEEPYTIEEDFITGLEIQKNATVEDGSGNLTLNSFVSSQANLELYKKTEDGEVDLSSFLSPIYIGISTLVDEENDLWEEVPIGLFNINSIEEKDTNKVEIKLYDLSTKFDFNYDFTNLFENQKVEVEIYDKDRNENIFEDDIVYNLDIIGEGSHTLYVGNHSYSPVYEGVGMDFTGGEEPLIDEGGSPLTIKSVADQQTDPTKFKAYSYQNVLNATYLAIIEDICSKAMIDIDQSVYDLLLNPDYKTGSYDNSINARQYISWLAEQSGCIATMTRDGKLSFVQLPKLQTPKIQNIPIDIVESYKIKETDDKNNSSYIYGSTIYQFGEDIFQSGDGDTPYYVDSSNMFIQDQEQIDQIQEIINNFEVTSVETGKILGNPSIDAYDKINIILDEGEPLSFIGNYSLKYNGGMIMQFNSNYKKPNLDENVTATGENTLRKYVKTEIDRTNAELRTVAQDVENKIEFTISPLQAKISAVIKDDDTGIITSEGYTFDGNGLKISKNEEEGYNTLINENGAYFRNGNENVAYATKDGFMTSNLQNRGQYFYNYNNYTNNYDFVAERYDDGEEEGYAHYYNG